MLIKDHFDSQYRSNAFFSPRDVSFVLYSKIIWDLAKCILKNCRVVVDLGAGGGTLLYNISKVSSAQMWAVDFSDESVQHLRKLIPGINILQKTIYNTSLEDGFCDFVASTMTIEHLNDHQMLQEASRILEKNGFFLVSSVLRSPYAWYFYNNTAGRRVLDPTHLREYESMESFLNLLEKHGFRIIKAEKSRIKFPFLDPLIKKIFGCIRNEKWNSIPATKSVEFLRKWSRIPIPGYYAMEVVAQKT